MERDYMLRPKVRRMSTSLQAVRTEVGQPLRLRSRLICRRGERPLRLSGGNVEGIQRAPHATCSALQNMRVDHRCRDVFVAE